MKHTRRITAIMMVMILLVSCFAPLSVSAATCALIGCCFSRNMELPRTTTRESACLTARRKHGGTTAWQESGKLVNGYHRD